MATKIQPDAPHPDSYRPDLPLKSEPDAESPQQRAYQRGRNEGREQAHQERRELLHSLAQARTRIASLERELASHSAPRAAEG